MLRIAREFYKRIKWSYNTDRLGPDIFSTYFLMYSPILARKICEKKFKYFGPNADIRHGAIVIGCSKISLGDSVVIRPGTYIVAGFQEGKNIHIKKGAWIAANTVILPGVTIGQNAVVAAGSIVNKDVPSINGYSI